MLTGVFKISYYIYCLECTCWVRRVPYHACEDWWITWSSQLSLCITLGPEGQTQVSDSYYLKHFGAVGIVSPSQALTLNSPTVLTEPVPDQRTAMFRIHLPCVWYPLPQETVTLSGKRWSRRADVCLLSLQRGSHFSMQSPPRQQDEPAGHNVPLPF